MTLRECAEGLEIMGKLLILSSLEKDEKKSDILIYVVNQSSKLMAVRDSLDTEIKSHRCGSACQQNCSAVAFDCCLDCNFVFDFF